MLEHNLPMSVCAAFITTISERVRTYKLPAMVSVLMGMALLSEKQKAPILGLARKKGWSGYETWLVWV